MGSYEVLETVAIADCALDVEGSDLADLFATGARALAELMVDPATIERTLRRQIALESLSVDLLFFDWLGELNRGRALCLPDGHWGFGSARQRVCPSAEAAAAAEHQ